MEVKVNTVDSISASVVMNNDLSEIVQAPRFHFQFECLKPNGEVRWIDDSQNLVVTAGKNDLLDKYFKGSAYTAAWKLGLKGTGTVSATDTLASHATWSEITPYSGNRPSISFGTSSAGSNTATAVSYAITSTATVVGAFVTDQATGTTGVLYSASDLAASRSVLSGDTLNITLTVSC